MSKSKTVAVFFLFFSLFAIQQAAAQRKKNLPVISLQPLEKSGDPSFCDPVADTVSDTLILTLRLMGMYNVKELPEEEWTGRSENEVADDNRLDHIIQGSVTIPEEGGVRISLSVYNSRSNNSTEPITIAANSFLEVFDITDQLMIQMIESFTNEHFAYGSVSIENSGSGGDYWVSLNGDEIGKNITQLTLIPQGIHQIKIYTRENLRTQLVEVQDLTVTEGQESVFSFTLNSAIGNRPEKVFTLKSGQRIEMTDQQWKDFWNSDQLRSARVFRGVGIGTLVAGLGVSALGGALMGLIAGLEYSLGDIPIEAEGILYGGSGVIVGLGLIMTIPGFIFLGVSGKRLKENLNNEFAVSAAPILSPNPDGTFSPGLKIALKF